ncbi:hypothetical protein I79_018273 [Cricetulus griseus]|uniref:Uncharacterized protein n=1 Tax=Cricetulus griseus TaxID=10029 RepID=G3I496_CRIGR|nr:hypothetical protein I79_018273 [Cricetulus griseus]
MRGHSFVGDAGVSRRQCLSRVLPGRGWRARQPRKGGSVRKTARLRAPGRPLQAVPEADAGGAAWGRHSHCDARRLEGGASEGSPYPARASGLGPRDRGRKPEDRDAALGSLSAGS